MNIWLLIFIMGLGTFLTRFSFMYLSDKITVSDNFSRALRFIPPTVLMGLIFPPIFEMETLNFTDAFLNPRLFAALVAAFIGYKFKNILYSLIIGMATLYFFQAIL